MLRASKGRHASTLFRAHSRTSSKLSVRRSPHAGSQRRRTSWPRWSVRAVASWSRSRTRARPSAPSDSCGRSTADVVEHIDVAALRPVARVRRQPGPSRLRLARPRCRAAAGHAGLPEAAAARRRAARPRAPVVRRSSRGRSRRARGSRRRPAPRLRDEGRRGHHARLPLPRVPGRGSAVRPTRADREGLALHRGGREVADAVEARREGVAEPQEPRARVGAGARWRAPRALRAAPPGARARRST